MFAWKVGPALAAGNCVVMKPAEQTPLSALVRNMHPKLCTSTDQSTNSHTQRSNYIDSVWPSFLWKQGEDLSLYLMGLSTALTLLFRTCLISPLCSAAFRQVSSALSMVTERTWATP